MTYLKLVFEFLSCNKEDKVVDMKQDPAYKITKNISYNGVSVNIINTLT